MAIRALSRLTAFVALLASPVAAQELRALPEDQPLHMAEQVVIDAAAAEDERFEMARVWEGDFLGGAEPDHLLQAAYSVGGGNAVILRHWLMEGRADELTVLQELSLPDGVKSARREGDELVLVVYKLLPADPACCASGEEEFRFPLN